MARPGSNLRKARGAAGLTQEELAQAMGYKNASQICRWESGERVLSYERLFTAMAVIERLKNERDKAADRSRQDALAVAR